MTIIETIDVEKATLLKEKGNELFKKKDYEGASKLYYEALSFCQLSSDSDEILIDNNEEKERAAHEKRDDAEENDENNKEFNHGNRKEETIESEQDRKCRELEAMLRSNLAACFVQMAAYNRAITEATKSLKLLPNYNKALYRRYQAYEALDKLEEALNDAKLLHETNPDSKLAKSEYERLQSKLEAKRKQELDEMLSKLKDLGNSILGKFGLSLDNFKFQKDEKTGSYSININNSTGSSSSNNDSNSKH
jgi:tetratricopeptide (TPR) repeat protein